MQNPITVHCMYSGAFSASIGCNAHISVDKSLAVADLVIFEGDCIKKPALLKVKTKKRSQQFNKLLL